MPTPEGWFTPGGVTPADKEVSETTMPNMNVTYHGTTRRYRRETRNNYADQTTEFYRINGKSAPGKIMSNFNKVDVKFTSDSDEKVSTGFKLNWFKISPVEIGVVITPTFRMAQAFLGVGAGGVNASLRFWGRCVF